MPVLESVTAGLVTRAAGGLGARVLKAAEKSRAKKRAAHLATAKTLDGHKVTSQLQLGDLAAAFSTDLTAEQVATAVESADFQALVHELLAIRVVGAAGQSINQVRKAMIGALIDHFPKAKMVHLELIGNGLFAYLDGECEAVSKSLEKEHAQTISSIREGANFALIRRTLEGLEQHLAVLSGAGRPSLQECNEFATNYRRQVALAHGTITPPDFERRRKVPLEALHVDPTLNEVADDEEAVVHGLERFIKYIDRTVLLGDPGGGKSTTSSVLMHRCATSTDNRLPFLVVLREFPVEPGERASILEHIVTRVANYYQIRTTAALIERYLVRGQAIVLFDGLDELLDTTRRREMTEIVEMFSGRYPLVSILVTSRKVGYQQAPMDVDTFSVFEVAEFSQEQVLQYVSKWFAQEDLHESDRKKLSESFMEESSSVSDLRTNPLMLALMCIIYRGQRFIPRNRPEVYERCATMLFDKWDSSRHIHVNLQAGRLVDPILKHLAYWLMTSPSLQDGVTESELIRETTNYLWKRTFEDEYEAKRAAKELVDFCKGRAWVFSDVGTTAEGEALYKFTHRTFMEYFAGYQLTRSTGSPEALARKLLPKVAVGEWDVVAQLAVQIENKYQDNGADRVLSHMLYERRSRSLVHRGNVLGFIARCATFHRPAPALVRKLTTAVIDNLLRCSKASTIRRGYDHPLLHLLNGSEAVDIIADQLKKEIDQLVDHSRPDEIQLSGWRVLMGLLITYDERSATASTWQEFCRQYLEERRDDFLAASEKDFRLRHSYVINGFESIESFVNTAVLDPAYPLRHLYYTKSDELFGVRYITVAEWALLARSSTREHTAVQSDMLAIADYIDKLGPPPWPIAEADLEKRWPWIPDRIPDLSAWTDPSEWFAAVVLICVGCELTLNPAEFVESLNDPGVRNLILVRTGKAAVVGDLSRFGPDSLSEEKRRLLRRWGSNELNFLRVR